MNRATDGGEIFVPHSKAEDVLGAVLCAVACGVFALILYVAR